MADPDPPQHEADASPEPHAGDDSQQPATPKRSWRPNVWLATVSTAVAVATGMFTLRDRIFPPEAGNATASIGQYQQSVGDICRELNEADRAGARSARRFAAKLKRARTTLAERNAVLDSRRAVLTRSERGLAHFEGLNVPRALLALQRVTVAAWNRGVERLRDFTRRLDAAASRRSLLAAIQTQPAMRAALDRNRVARSAGLIQLGGGLCRLNAPIVIPTITLPPLRPSSESLAPGVQPPQAVEPPRPSEAPTPGVLPPPPPPPPPLEPPPTRSVRPPPSPPRQPPIP
jgi:hypothetical protein